MGLAQTSRRGGAAIDILSDSARQGALQKALLAEHALITKTGYKEQATNYRNMASAAEVEIQDANRAGERAIITAWIRGIGALLTFFTPGGSSLGDPTTAGALY
jgi:hypothetical protein